MVLRTNEQSDTFGELIMGELKNSVIRVPLALCLLFSPVAIPAALAAQGAEAIEEVVVTGSRRAARSATDAAVPVDVFTGDEIGRQGSHDMDDLLRNLIPSYNVQRAPISDAATIVRPANLRGLQPAAESGRKEEQDGREASQREEGVGRGVRREPGAEPTGGRVIRDHDDHGQAAQQIELDPLR